MFGPSDTLPLVDFSQPTPHHTRTPVNRRLCYVDLCTVFCSNDAARAFKSHPKVARSRVGYRSAMANTPAGANTVLTPPAVNAPAGASKPSSRPPLHTTRSLLQRFVRDIQYNFIKFNVHRKLQGCGLPAQQALTPVSAFYECTTFIISALNGCQPLFAVFVSDCEISLNPLRNP